MAAVSCVAPIPSLWAPRPGPAAELTPTPTPHQLAAVAQAKQEAHEAAEAAPTAEEAGAVLKAWRCAARAARASGRRITAHSFRRGWIQ
ncbi:hypothetical protein KBP30_00535 [Streptomyces sp. Go40/10]|uniref:hypothetical protein n=1 Tax=Streptomyces sp. Go40/10 TaxID=2825844 RepID=UPI001E331983|nr:hypothetical protein [Streptomyces sp. Go40/10]UFQ99812.1 hypothetical protein KBP30_00535 [Streptomyces sp. Go40/10]